LKILVVAMRYGYGLEERGYSYEYYNFYLPLRDLFGDVELFDFMGLLATEGRELMNAALVARVREAKPDLTLFSLYTDQILPETVDAIRAHTTTLCFFHDDAWRLDFARFWAGHFDWFTTPDAHRVAFWRSLGYGNVVHFPYAVNPQVYRRMPMEKKQDVTFVGMANTYRRWLIKRLKRRGYAMVARGAGWPSGHVSQEEMVQTLSTSKISLNISNSVSWDARYLLSSPRALYNTLHSKKTAEQMKARPFEICGCGAFQLTHYVQGLERYYLPGEELEIYLDPDDLVRKLEYFLSHDEEREAIAKRGYERTLSEHTYGKRFRSVLARIGLTT